MVLKRSDLSRLARALEGLPILGCMEDSPAARAGVRYGDVLLSVDGQATPSWEAFLLARQRSGAAIQVEIWRDGETLSLSIPIDRTRSISPLEVLAAGARALGVDTPSASTLPV